ncbi:hypothetical protein FSP39_000595 [Pinctada imbricata]|uniref:Uncharacterized protein n=1 Tax=Pinctada imbricata TaxID=66713 RepID=A0AA89C276_PINIB|nr:hypothetical protein FSP39_000595 [Pinctada imbricata]
MRMAMLSKMFGGGGAGGAAGGMGTGLGGMDPFTTMALLKGGGGGSNKALSMIAMMNMLKPNPAPAAATNALTVADPAAAAAAAAATSVGGAAAGGTAMMTSPVMTAPVVDPMTNTLMQMSLCQRSEAAAESRICTPLTCKLQSLARHGNPNLLQCRPLLGCCFSDMKSMVMANMLKSM